MYHLLREITIMKEILGLKECKFCKHVVHCPSNKEKNKTGASQTQTKKDLMSWKPNQDDRLITKVKTAYLNNNAFDIQPMHSMQTYGQEGNKLKHQQTVWQKCQ